MCRVVLSCRQINDFDTTVGEKSSQSGHNPFLVDGDDIDAVRRGWRLLLAFGREGHGPGEFWLPAGIHIDAKDRIWVADSYNRRVQVFQYLRGDD